MTVGDENKIETKIGHPRLFGGYRANLNIVNFERNVENDIDFIPIGRNTAPPDWYKRPEVQASDMLEISDTFQSTTTVATRDEDGTAALPQSIIVDNGKSFEISGNDREEIDISSAGFASEIHFGATKIKDGSVTVRNDTAGVTLTEGTEYSIDYDNGIVSIFSQAGTKNDNYSIGYKAKNTPRNIAMSLAKIPKLGGASVFNYCIDQDYTGSSKGIEFTVFVEAANMNLEAGRPNRAEINFDMRVAKPVEV